MINIFLFTDKLLTYVDNIETSIIKYAPKIALAGVILWIGMKVVKKLTSLIELGFEKANLSPSIRPFLVSIINVSMKIFIFFIVAGIIGIDLSAFVGILAAAAFAIGMALQGSLGNFASGIIILIFKPYKSGDWVSIDDKFGKVEEIQIFNTIILTPGHKTLIVPNSEVTGNIVTNYSRKGFIRLELNVTMPYEESYPKVEKIIFEALEGTPLMLDDPKPEVGIESYDSHNIVLAVRPYCTPDHFWEVTFEALKRIKKGFHDNDIKVAYSEGVEIGSIGE